MTTLKLLKVYTYRGYKIHVRQVGNDIVEFLIPNGNNIHTWPFLLEKKGKYKEIAAATLIVCRQAERVVDEIVKKKKLWYNVKRLLGIKGRFQSQRHESEKNQKAVPPRLPVKDIGSEGNESKLQNPEQDYQVGQEGEKRQDAQRQDHSPPELPR